ncbi:MAG TPA: PAS domain S-box protein, partial [Anaerolineales bacterium]
MSSDRIMIVEAGSPTSLDLRKKLAALGYSVVAQASQGEDAVQIAGQQRPDLVLMDLHLKGKLDGIQAAGRIKALYNIPVIFLSANMDVVTLEQARAAEPYSYIIKPFEERELESNITVALYKHETERRLRETEAKYQTLFNIMAQGVVYQDAKGQITAANPAAGRILGLSQDELLARSSFDPAWKAIREDGSPLPVEDQPPMLAIRTGREVTGQVLGLFQPQKGEYVWIRANSVPQFENGSSVPGMVVTTFEEITDTKKFEDGLKASEVRYRSLVETSPDGITLNDLQGHFLAANRQALGMLGFSSFEELQASRATSFDFVADPCWLSRPESLLKTLSEDSPHQLEYTFRRRDGSTFPADASLALLRDAADQPQAFLTINRDVSDRKRSEVQLRNLSQAVVQSADSIVITDTEGRIEFVNPQFEQTTGYSLEEVLGKNPRILKSGEQSREFYQDLWETIKSGRIWRGELHNRRKDGSYFWEEASIAPVVDEDGTVSHYIASKRDITERKQLEQVMRIKDSAITSSINAIALADLNGRLTYVNPAFVRLWGYISADEIVGKSVAGIWREDAPVGEVILSLLQGKGWQGELYAKRSDGSYMDVDVSAHLVLDETGKPLCIMSSFVDITARKQAEAAEKEEHRLSEALRLTAEALSSSLKLDEVLEMVLENAGQVIANDSMTIMLLEGENLKVVRHRGYAERGLKDYIENNQFKIEDF